MPLKKPDLFIWHGGPVCIVLSNFYVTSLCADRLMREYGSVNVRGGVYQLVCLPAAQVSAQAGAQLVGGVRRTVFFLLITTYTLRKSLGGKRRTCGRLLLPPY